MHISQQLANKGRQDWVDCLQKSIKKYNLYCQATECQIQQYLMGKYESFLANADIQSQAVGLQSIAEDDVTAEEIGIPTDVQIWVLNESTQVKLRITWLRCNCNTWRGIVCMQI